MFFFGTCSRCGGSFIANHHLVSRSLLLGHAPQCCSHPKFATVALSILVFFFCQLPFCCLELSILLPLAAAAAAAASHIFSVVVQSLPLLHATIRVLCHRQQHALEAHSCFLATIPTCCCSSSSSFHLSSAWRHRAATLAICPGDHSCRRGSVSWSSFRSSR